MEERGVPGICTAKEGDESVLSEEVGGKGDTQATKSVPE